MGNTKFSLFLFSSSPSEQTSVPRTICDLPLALNGTLSDTIYLMETTHSFARAALSTALMHRYGPLVLLATHSFSENFRGSQQGTIWVQQNRGSTLFTHRAHSPLAITMPGCSAWAAPHAPLRAGTLFALSEHVSLGWEPTRAGTGVHFIHCCTS